MKAGRRSPLSPHQWGEGKGEGKTVGVVLAAGASRRAGFAKGLARLGRRTLLSVAIDTLRRAGCGQVTVVVGGLHRSALRRVARANRAEVVVNQEPERGMFSSLQLGLCSLRGQPRAVVVSLVDHPHVSVQTVAALISLVSSGAGAAIPRFRKRAGHPFVVNWSAAWALATASAETTAQRVLARARDVRHLTVDDAAVLEDLDTARALKTSGARPPAAGR